MLLSPLQALIEALLRLSHPLFKPLAGAVDVLIDAALSLVNPVLDRCTSGIGHNTFVKLVRTGKSCTYSRAKTNRQEDDGNRNKICIS